MHTVLTCFITWLKVLLKVLVLIIAILFHTVIGIGIGNTFFGLVLVLNIAILFTSIVNNPDGQSISISQNSIQRDHCQHGRLMWYVVYVSCDNFTAVALCVVQTSPSKPSMLHWIDRHSRAARGVATASAHTLIWLTTVILQLTLKGMMEGGSVRLPNMRFRPIRGGSLTSVNWHRYTVWSSPTEETTWVRCQIWARFKY